MGDRSRGPLVDRPPRRMIVGEVAALERTDPEEADRCYSALERANLATYPVHFVVAVAAPVLAMLVAYLVTPELSADRTLSTALIVFFGGYLPAAVLFGNRVIATGGFTDVSTANRTGSILLIAALMMFEGVGYVITVAIAYLFVAIPVFIVVATVSTVFAGTAWSEPEPWLSYPIFVPLFVATMIFTFSDTHPRVLLDPRRGVTEIGAGVRARLTDTAQIFAGLAIGVVLAGQGPLELVYDRLDVALGAAAVSGLLLGLAIFRIPRDGQEEFLIVLGRARCDVRLGKFGRARYRLGRLDDNPRTVKGGDAGQCIVDSLAAITNSSGFHSRLDRTLDSAQQEAAGAGLRPEFDESFTATRRLAADVAAGGVSGAHLP